MYQSYDLLLPRPVLFGRGKRFELGKHLPDNARVLLICGNHYADSPDLDRLLAGYRFDIFRYAGDEPTLDAVEEARSLAKTHGIQAVVAVGGGSVIDLGKAVAALVPLTGGAELYFYGKLAIPGHGLFFAALPTTAGTGAEITPNAVLSDPATQIKTSLRHAEMTADVAIIDPELTDGCPFAITARSGFDSLTQAIESAISRKRNPLSSAMATAAIREILPQLENACANDPFARDRLAEATMLGAMAFIQSGLGAVHGLAHPIGSLYHVPHGEACAILLPEVLRLNHAFVADLVADLYGGCKTADGWIQELEELRKRCGIDSNFHTYGLNPKDFGFILKNCRSGSMSCNPRELGDNEIIALLEKLL